MEELILDLAKKFNESIPKGETELAEAIEPYLRSSAERMKHTKLRSIEVNEDTIKGALKSITKDLINCSLEQKKQMIIPDKNMDAVREISGKSYEIACKILDGEKVEEEFDTGANKKLLYGLNSKVRDFNKAEASELISEGLLDMEFIEDPHTNAVSLRLGHIISYNKRMINKDEER